jgi:hypothetical protein
MTRQYGLELIASRKRALRVAKLASRTVRAIVEPPSPAWLLLSVEAEKGALLTS